MFTREAEFVEGVSEEKLMRFDSPPRNRLNQPLLRFDLRSSINENPLRLGGRLSLTDGAASFPFDT